MYHLAQVQTNLEGTINAIGELGNPGTEAPGLFVSIISGTIGLLTIIAGIYFAFILITGAISWIGAGGDSQKLENARKKITNGAIGIAIVVAAIFAVEIVGQLLVFDYILDPAAIISTLTPGGEGVGGTPVSIPGGSPDFDVSCNDQCIARVGRPCTSRCFTNGNNALACHGNFLNAYSINCGAVIGVECTNLLPSEDPPVSAECCCQN